MEIEGKITILSSLEGVTIEIHDDKASVTFVKVSLTAEQFCQALSRLSYTECEKVEVFGLEKVGKTMEWKTNMVNLPLWESIPFGKRHDYGKNEAKKQCPDGWVSSGYLKSQDSIVKENGKTFARDTIRRWK